MKIAVHKNKGALYPYADSDKQTLAKYPDGLVDVIDITGKRNVKLFKKFWSLCRLILDNDREKKFRDLQNVKDSLMISAGYVDQCWNFDGTFYLRPHSVAWENCSNEKFQDIWEKIMPIVCGYLDCTEDEIEENIVFHG